MAISGTALAAILGGGALSAGGSLLGGLLGGGDQFSSSQILAAGFNPQADPLQNAVTIQNLINLGFPVDAVLGNAAPLAQLQNAVGTGTLGFTEREEARLSNALRRAAPALEEAIEQGLTPDRAGAHIRNAVFEGGAGQGDKRLAVFLRALSGTGTKTVESLFTAEQNFRQSIQQFSDIQQQQQQAAATDEGGILAGQQRAREAIAQLQGGISPVTEEEIARREEQFRSQARERLLETANVGGFNPAAGLSRLESDPNALASALTLLGGQTNIAGQQIQALQQSLLNPLQVAQQGSQVGLNAQLGGAQLAADQAQALAQLSAQTNQAQAQALGGGIAGGLQGLGGTGQLLGLLQSGLLNQGAPGVS